MAVTYSEMIELGMDAPAFDLPIANPGVDDHTKPTRNLSDYDEARVLVIVFTCNHCPYAKHVEGALIQFARDYAEQGMQVVAISSNDAEVYPEDSFENMVARAQGRQYPFPYLYDESQHAARAYEARCTPDFYVYGPDRTLQYRGRMDETRPGQGKATAHDLRRAVEDVLAGRPVSIEQVPSMGCNIKWKAGNAPR